MPSITFTPGPLNGIIIIQPAVFRDDRGYFFESYNKLPFQEAGINTNFVQDGHSRSKKGTLRGLHFQKPPYAQEKLVRAVNGAVFDVSVDIRKNSPTYGKWFGIELSEENNTMVFIPAGFAHGFMALQDDTHFLYKYSHFYTPPSEGGLIATDPALDIQWPLAGTEYQMSEKDKLYPTLSNLESPF